jgi:hypothetical protein
MTLQTNSNVTPLKKKTYDTDTSDSLQYDGDDVADDNL